MRSVRRRIGKLEKTGLPMDAAYRSLREKVGGNLTGLVRRIDGPISPFKGLPKINAGTGLKPALEPA